MKTKDLERLKEYCKDITEHQYICRDREAKFAHDFTTIAQNEIVKKNKPKCNLTKQLVDLPIDKNLSDRINDLEKENKELKFRNKNLEVDVATYKIIQKLTLDSLSYPEKITRLIEESKPIQIDKRTVTI